MTGGRGGGNNFFTRTQYHPSAKNWILTVVFSSGQCYPIRCKNAAVAWELHLSHLSCFQWICFPGILFYAWYRSPVLKSQCGNLAPPTVIRIYVRRCSGCQIRKTKTPSSIEVDCLTHWPVVAFQILHCSALYILEHPNNPSRVSPGNQLLECGQAYKTLSIVLYSSS